MVVAELLGMLGAPGWVVIAAVVVLGLWHFRSLLKVLSSVGTVVQIGAAIVGGLIVASTGVIPGLDVDITVVPGQLLDLAVSVVDAVVGALPLGVVQLGG